MSTEGQADGRRSLRNLLHGDHMREITQLRATVFLANRQSEDTEVSEGCAFAVVEGGPKGLSFMVGRDTNNGPWRVLRTDVDEGSAIATISGIRLGATEAQVKAAYQGPGKGGSLTVETHPYVPTGHYLLYDVDGKGGRLLIFETDGTKVTEFRAGDEAAVQAIEGCA